MLMAGMPPSHPFGNMILPKYVSDTASKEAGPVNIPRAPHQNPPHSLDLSTDNHGHLLRHVREAAQEGRPSGRERRVHAGTPEQLGDELPCGLQTPEVREAGPPDQEVEELERVFTRSGLDTPLRRWRGRGHGRRGREGRERKERRGGQRRQRRERKGLEARAEELVVDPQDGILFRPVGELVVGGVHVVILLVLGISRCH